MFYKLCFVIEALTRIELALNFNYFLDEKQEIFLLWPYLISQLEMHLTRDVLWAGGTAPARNDHIEEPKKKC